MHLSIYQNLNVYSKWLSKCLSKCLSIFLSKCLSKCLSKYLSRCLSIYLSKYIDVYLYAYLNVYLNVLQNVYLMDYLDMYLNVYLNDSLNIWWCNLVFCLSSTLHPLPPYIFFKNKGRKCFFPISKTKHSPPLFKKKVMGGGVECSRSKTWDYTSLYLEARPNCFVKVFPFENTQSYIINDPGK